MKTFSKTIIYVIKSVSILVLSSCSLLSEDDKIILNQDKIFKKDAENIYFAFRDRDTEKLEKMFCEKATKHQEIHMEIEKMFDFIDGNIVSYESISDAGESTVIEGGKAIRLNGAPSLYNVKTDKGAIYRIHFSDVLIYDADPTWLGVCEIVVTRIENDSYTDSFKIGAHFEY